MSFFFKSQVFSYFRAQVFELSEETQGVVTGVHGMHVPNLSKTLKGLCDLLFLKTLFFS